MFALLALLTIGTASVANAAGPTEAHATSVADVGPTIENPVVAPSRLAQYAATGSRPAYWAFIPSGSTAPRTILLALHGIGQVGDSLGGQLMPFAQQQNWVIVAPTIDWGEWRDPDRLALAEARVLPQVLDVVDHARRELGVPTRDRIIVYGFSRGAHAAARLGLLYPSRVVAVAAASGSAYTLPTATARNGAGRPVDAPFPIGIGNITRYFGKTVDPSAISRVQYWVGVGANDDRDSDAPRAWDAVLGKNRLERAGRFANAMEQAGCVTRISVTAGAGHELLPPAIDDSVRFLAGALRIDSLWEARHASRPASPSQTPRARDALVPGIVDLPPDSFVQPTAMLPLRAGASPISQATFTSKLAWTRLVARYVAQ